MSDLIAQAAAASDDFLKRAIRPARELGAYEALWMRPGTSFKTLADLFRQHPDAVPSDFVPEAEAQQHAHLALGLIRQAGIERFGIRVAGASEYPEKLRDARHPLALLYFQGNWDLTSSRCVAVVGTRNPSPEGVQRTTKLARQLVADGYTIVSGLARGVDTAAHRAAIEANGRTIAVIGTPITRSYPSENDTLQRTLAKDYLVISQVPIVRHSRQGPKGNRIFFPERNVTMSALTEATIIVEAGETSGTLVQARHALAQGRRLFILDNCFNTPGLTWPARFREQGAIRVRDYDEIRAELSR